MKPKNHSIINMIEVVNRLKEITGTSLDQDLAKLMGVAIRSVAQWKSRNSIPTEKLTEFCIAMGYDLQYVLTGKMTKTTKPPKRHLSADYSVFPELEILFKQAVTLWKSLDTPSRFELASKISKELQTMEITTNRTDTNKSNSAP